MEIVQVNSIKAWLLAARPKTLAGAATPVLLGCALAYADSCFQMTPALLCFAFAFLTGWKENSKGTPIIITNGLGTSRVDVRLFTPSEVVLVVLHRVEKQKE